MEKRDKVMVAGLILILVFMLINIFSAIHTMDDYEARKESGNERWLQVENRILQIEEKVNRLEEKLDGRNVELD